MADARATLPRRRPRGTTLIEAMIALALLLGAALGLVGLNMAGVRMNASARRVGRATALAQDLVTQIQTWDYTDVRLANTNVGNDADIADGALAYQGATAPASDHTDDELDASYLGLPTAAARAQGFQRYWNVATPDDANGNGTPDCARVAVIVRWQDGLAWRRIVLVTAKINPADTQ